MGAPVVHWEVRARDTGKLHEFYRSLFGWSIDSNNPHNYGLVDTGVKMGINGGIAPAEDRVPPGPTFYVQVEDVQAYLSKAESLGGRVLMPVTEVPNMVTMATFSDPEGNVIGIVKGPQSPPKKTTPKKRTKTARKSPKGKAKVRRRRR
jgi:predicted enzyme related to lactoylglutathione lyase